MFKIGEQAGKEQTILNQVEEEINMNPTMMHMVVRAEQDEKLQRARRHWAYDAEQASNRDGELKKAAYRLAFSGVIGVLALLVSWLIMAI
jgi:putative SOS response-associated peptidase YedK